MMRRMLLPALVMILAFLAVPAFAKQTGSDKRPNILFIMSDDHAFQAIGAYGSKVNKTPHIDRIAKEGMRFDRCFVTNSICGPCRAVILTGKYNHLNGFTTNEKTFYGGQPHVGKMLQAAGYQTAVIGKWHLVSDPTGFDHWEILQGQGPYYNPVMKTAKGLVPHTGYTTEIITDLALDWLKNQRQADKPFFMLYQHKAPHRQWQPGPKYLDHYKDVTIPEPPTLFDDYQGRTASARLQKMSVEKDLSDDDLKISPPQGLTPEQKAIFVAAYAEENAALAKANLQGKDRTRWNYQRYVKDYLRCVDAVDDNVGRVLDYLDESGLTENTIVVYTSDQGWYLGEHGWYDKRWMYEESFRTPLMVRWPGKVKPGSVSDAMVMNLDFAETFLEAAGVPVPAEMQGKSLVDVLQGKVPKDWRKSVYYHYYEYPVPHAVHPHYGVRTERYKLIYFYTRDEWELFDLQTDPQELKSRYGEPEFAKITEELQQELKRLREQYKDDGSVAEFPTDKPMKGKGKLKG